jgi:signal transduction histidine kinase
MATQDAHSEMEIEELRERISWLIRLRWVAAVGVVITVAAASRVLDVQLSELPLCAITAALAVYNALLWAMKWRLPAVSAPSNLAAFANIQIGCDLLFLAALLHFSGGIENPFRCYYVFHIVIASILLSRRATYVHAGIAVGLVSLMAGLEAAGSIPHYHLALIEPHLYSKPVYLLASLFVLATTLYFTAFMATSIASTLREREREIVHLSRSLRQHTDELEQSYESLARLERSKSMYLHRVAHHLRSPLTAIERMLAVVVEGRTGALPQRAYETLDRSRQRVRGVLDLARDLLALSRAREAASSAEGAVNLAEVAANVVNDFRQAAASASVSLQLEVGSGLEPIAGDPESISELFENLISNAVKYTPSGGKVTVAVGRRDDQIGVSVADSGIGIPEEDLESIFDEFYRAENARDTGKEGTGLGLSIVRAVAKAHGGDVTVESKVGVGSTFRVVIPALPAAAVRSRASETAASG